MRDSAEDRRLCEWLGEGESLAMSVLGWAEFRCGPVTDAQLRLAERIVPERIPVLESDAVRAASLFNAGGRRRGSLVDCLIAAVAVRCEAALATSDAEDFRRLREDALILLTV